MKKIKLNPFKGMKNLKKKAEDAYKDNDRLNNILNEVDAKSMKVGAVSEIIDQIKILGSMVADYMKGNYKNISKKSIILIIGGFIYFLSPVDLIPDFILGLGFLDDVAVFNFVLASLLTEIEHYKTWKGISI